MESFKSLYMNEWHCAIIFKVTIKTWWLIVFSVLTTLSGLIAPKGWDTNGFLGPMLGLPPLQLTDHNTGISLLLSTTAWVLLSPPIACRLDQRLENPVHGQCGERSSPKVQPLTRPGTELRNSWLAVRDLTNCANLAHTLMIVRSESFVSLLKRHKLLF